MKYRIFLTIVGILIVALAILSKVSEKSNDLSSFPITAEELHAEILNNDFSIEQNQLSAILSANQEAVQLIDLRPSSEYEKGHLAGALNIPFHSLLDSEYRDLFSDENVQKLFYSDDLIETNGAWMITFQNACKNLKIIDGIYDKNVSGNINTTVDVHDVAKYKFDLLLTQAKNEAAKQIEMAEKATDVKVIPFNSKPVVKARSKAVKVAPKKVTVEDEEEEEGC